MTPRVLHICQRDDPATGGAVRVAAEYVKRLPEFGVDAHCLFLYGEPGHFKSVLGARSHYLGLRDSKDVLKFTRLPHFLREFGPHVVHHHDGLLWPSVLTYFHPRFSKFMHAHLGANGRLKPARAALAGLFQRRSNDMLVCITEDTRRSQVEHGKYSLGRTCVIRNGIDLEHFRPPCVAERRAARGRFGVGEGEQAVGFVGRLDCGTKGADDFLKMFALLPPGCRALVVGDGPDAGKLRGLAASLGVEPRVSFAGVMQDTREAYHAMDVLCLTSHVEPFGLVVAEAMACRVPVVGFACPGGVGELLTPSTGSVVVERKAEVMAEAVLRILAGPHRVTDLTDNAVALIKESHDWRRSAGELTRVYVEQLTRGRAVTSSW